MIFNRRGRRTRAPVARTGVPAPANPAPTDIALSSSSVPQNAAAGFVVGVLSVVDPGESTWSFAITGGSTKFALSAGSGATVQLLRGLTGTLTAGVSETVEITATDGAGGQRIESFVLPVFDPLASFTMPIGLRNYGASAVGADEIIQFGVPVDIARQINPASMSLSLRRDSDNAVVPVQMDLTSTSRTGGHLLYFVATAKLPSSIAGVTTVPCTLTISPGGTYSGGAAPVTLAQMIARDFKLEATGDNISGTGVAGFNPTDAVYVRQIKNGAVEAGWEGWSRIKSGGVAQGQWGVRWRVMGRADTALSDWRVEVVVFCSAVDNTPFPSSPFGRTGTFVLKAGSTTLNNAAAFTNVFVSPFTGFKMYGGSDSILPAHGGATLRPVHDRDYLVQEKAIYPFRWTSDAEGGWSDTYTPGSRGWFRSNWGNGGIDGTIGPMSSVSYNMLRSLSDDTLWRRGHNAGLCQLSVSIHYLDPATGYVRPKFGTYSGLGTANTARNSWLTTHNSSGSVVMTAEYGHYCDTAFAPGLLTGELALIEGLREGFADAAYRDSAYNCPQYSGSTRRQYPFLYHFGLGATLTRYDDWPHRGMLHYCYLADDGRHDKAYANARLAETAGLAQDWFVDFRAITSFGVGQNGTSVAYDGVKDGSSTTNAWALALVGFSGENAYGASGAGWRADVPWSVDYRMYVLWLAGERNGEAYAQATVEGFFGRYMIGRSIGPGQCTAYGATAFNPPSQIGPNLDIVQDWTTYWQRFFNNTTTPGTRTVCPTTAAPDEVGKVEHKYVQVLNLLERAGWAGAYGYTYRDAYNAVNNCFGGGGTTWAETTGGRWVMEALP